MSGLVDPADVSRIRDFSAHTGARPVSVAAPNPIEAESEALRLEVERLTRALADAGKEADAAVSRAREEGRAAGRAEAIERQEDRMRLLRDSLGAAARAFEARLELLDGLAPALVRAALEKLFGETANWSAMSEAMVARQLAVLREAGIISISVSPEDFADTSALAEQGAYRILLDPQLRAGACRIACKLGQLDLDVRQQWSELATVLEGMAAA